MAHVRNFCSCFVQFSITLCLWLTPVSRKSMYVVVKVCCIATGMMLASVEHLPAVTLLAAAGCELRDQELPSRCSWKTITVMNLG